MALTHAVVSSAWILFPARITCGESFGVRQPRCRSSRTHGPARGLLLTRLVTGMPGMLVTSIESVS
jgi:hypothetical protein